MDVWEDHATSWLDDIIEAISVHPKKIVKVRAGYILEEKQKISDQRIDLWRAFAQRGSSRKLDPDSPYMPKWSENWMISLNV